MKSFEELLKKAKDVKSVKLALVGAHDPEGLSAVMHASRQDVVDPIFVGYENAVNEASEEEGVDISGIDIVEPDDPDLMANKACELICDGEAGALMKGKVSTGSILKAVLNKKYGLRGPGLLSHVILLENPHYHKLFLMSDAAMVINPSLSDKVAITKNAIGVMQKLGIEEPKVAMIAAIEKVNYEHMPATVDSAILAQMGRRGQFGEAIVDGPFALDNAISKESARIKGVESPVAGEADIVILPDIEAGNVLYKSLMWLSDTKSAGIVVGSKVPVVLLSRADSEEDKYHSIAMASLCS